MTEAQACEILARWMHYGELRCGSPWIDVSAGDGDVVLDGTFSPDELEAIAWWLRNKVTT
jgi:hypothetical protein